MRTVNSLSGGKTSSYMAVHYPADFNVFALVRIEDIDNLWMKGKDEKTRQAVSDKIGNEFIGTAEMDEIIYTILDLEQVIGKPISWVTGPTFESVIKERGNYLPNKMARFCTSEMKIVPIFNFVRANCELPVIMNIGYRPNERSRVDSLQDRAGTNGIETFKCVTGRSKNGNTNTWGEVDYRMVRFPLVENNITKDVIYHYWQGKPVRFAYRNNCVGCINRNPLALAHISKKDEGTFNWFVKQEAKTGNRFNADMTYKSILKFGSQGDLFEDDFADCDSGYCGV